MRAVVDQLEAQFMGKFSVVRIDINKQAEYISKYRIETIPITVIYDGNGNEISVFKEGVAAQVILAALNKAGMP